MAGQISFGEFEHALRAQLGAPLLRNRHDARGEWDAAHTLVQGESSPTAAWVHAYLHRRDGDDANASYWYARAGRVAACGMLADEWRAIAQALCAR